MRGQYGVLTARRGKPEVMIVGPTRSGGTTIMTEGFSKGRLNPILPDSSQVITIITTLQGTSFFIINILLVLFDVVFYRDLLTSTF